MMWSSMGHTRVKTFYYGSRFANMVLFKGETVVSEALGWDRQK